MVSIRVFFAGRRVKRWKKGKTPWITREKRVNQDTLDVGRIGDEGNDPHRSATMRASEWKYLEDTGKKDDP